MANLNRTSVKANWLVPAALILMSLIPFGAGFMRLFQLAHGGPVTPENARFFALPIPVVLHILSAFFYCVVGAFQFSPAILRRFGKWHRVAGRFLAVCGITSAITGLWMAQFYPLPHNEQGPLLLIVRYVVSSTMVAGIVFAVVQAVKKNIAGHRAWMTRAYALGLGAGTQAFTMLPWMLLVGPMDQFVRDVLMTLGWIVNALVAELVLRKQKSRSLKN